MSHEPDGVQVWRWSTNVDCIRKRRRSAFIAALRRVPKLEHTVLVTLQQTAVHRRQFVVIVRENPFDDTQKSASIECLHD